MHPCLPKLFGAASAIAVASSAVAQSPLDVPLQVRPVAPPVGMKWIKPHGKVFFNTNVGSFKLMATDENPAEGTLDMSFRGTLLISNLDPASTLIVTGNVRREINDEKYKRQVFFGDGRITIVGKFRSVQFFGRGLRAAFDGHGFGRLYGEFDKNLDTGLYWYQGFQTKTPWNTGGAPMQVPLAGAVEPKVKVKVKGG
ncbi:MAG TPA: hypothetical protein VK934_01375 [Fimbriimonas sp.]|nr:hypothetical protein [Fimbriimonas sp.]